MLEKKMMSKLLPLACLTTYLVDIPATGCPDFECYSSTDCQNKGDGKICNFKGNLSGNRSALCNGVSLWWGGDRGYELLGLTGTPIALEGRQSPTRSVSPWRKRAQGS